MEVGGGMKSRRKINQQGKKANTATKNVSVSEAEESEVCLRS